MYLIWFAVLNFVAFVNCSPVIHDNVLEFLKQCPNFKSKNLIESRSKFLEEYADDPIKQIKLFKLELLTNYDIILKQLCEAMVLNKNLIINDTAVQNSNKYSIFDVCPKLEKCLSKSKKAIEHFDLICGSVCEDNTNIKEEKVRPICRYTVYMINILKENTPKSTADVSLNVNDVQSQTGNILPQNNSPKVDTKIEDSQNGENHDNLQQDGSGKGHVENNNSPQNVLNDRTEQHPQTGISKKPNPPLNELESGANSGHSKNSNNQVGDPPKDGLLKDQTEKHPEKGFSKKPDPTLSHVESGANSVHSKNSNNQVVDSPKKDEPHNDKTGQNSEKGNNEQTDSSLKHVETGSNSVHSKNSNNQVVDSPKNEPHEDKTGQNVLKGNKEQTDSSLKHLLTGEDSDLSGNGNNPPVHFAKSDLNDNETLRQTLQKPKVEKVLDPLVIVTATNKPKNDDPSSQDSVDLNGQNDIEDSNNPNNDVRPVHSESLNINDGNSFFFSYFMVICVMVVGFYLIFHNKKRILAIVIEGRKGRRMSRSRRPNTANYKKLDTNLEEAISSSCKKTSSNVIY